VPSKDERQTRTDFSERYRLRAETDLINEIERRVIGEVWGANGFTTVAEADQMRTRLDLRSDSRLLDLGSGFGWPGLYLARESGCAVVVTDMPIEGLAGSVQRARSDNIKSLGAVACSGTHLPFSDGSFDAIVHTDVLC
jgi:SAM-dependent methyltransferase